MFFRRDRSPYRSSRRRRSKSRSRSKDRHSRRRHHRRDRSRSRSRTPSRSSRHHRNTDLPSPSSSNGLSSLLLNQRESRSDRVSSIALEALSKLKAGNVGATPLEGALIIDPNLDKDEAQKRLELEMQKVIPLYCSYLL